MASHTLATPCVIIHGTPVPVTHESHITLDALTKALDSVPFRTWVSDLDDELVVTAIHVQSVDFFGERVGFVKMVATATMHGKPVPGIVFLRGGAVAILVVLRCEGERWALCCRQPRVPCGSASFLEIPAGMLDGSGHFSGVAAKEMKEETGIDIRHDELVDMTELAYGGLGRHARGVYPSVGACDEFVRLMYFAKDVSRAELDSLKGKVTGATHEHEVITLDLIPLDQLWMRAPDGKTLASLLLFDRLIAAGALTP